jgi:hypothetical protein
MSKILKSVHRSAKRLHDTGHMNDVTMRQFDRLCPEAGPKLEAAGELASFTSPAVDAFISGALSAHGKRRAPCAVRPRR